MMRRVLNTVKMDGALDWAFIQCASKHMGLLCSRVFKRH